MMAGDRRQPYIKERLLFGPHTCRVGCCGRDGTCATDNGRLRERVDELENMVLQADAMLWEDNARLRELLQTVADWHNMDHDNTPPAEIQAAYDSMINRIKAAIEKGE